MGHEVRTCRDPTLVRARRAERHLPTAEVAAPPDRATAAARGRDDLRGSMSHGITGPLRHVADRVRS